MLKSFSTVFFSFFEISFNMILKIYKATNPAKRHCLDILFFYTHKTYVLKSQLKKQTKISGRNNSGKITIFNRGNSHKKRFRLINNNLKNLNLEVVVYSIEYNPNRNSALISVFEIKKKFFFYLIAPNEIKIGDLLCFGSKAQEKLGHFLNLKNIPIGCPIFNISYIFAKSAGTFAVLLSKTKNKVQVILSSGKKKQLAINSFCMLGSVSNENFFLRQLGKAGKSRWFGRKSKVKGIAMNPVDHPNGGGEGKKSSKRKSPWGKTLKSKK
jgi:large subunit ribosomal protein L2